MSSGEGDWRLVVGLGNAGRRYRGNRHNAGFLVLDALAEALGTGFSKMQMNSLIGQVNLPHSRLILAKPQTLMNRSGTSVAPLVRFYRLELSQLLVVYDDLDLPTAKIRLRPGGGSGGHLGMQSIIGALGEDGFGRLRLGIDRPPGRMDPADYVLQDFSHAETELMELGIRQAVDCVRGWLDDGIELAMNRCNET